MPFEIIMTDEALADLDEIAMSGDEESGEGERVARAILRQIARLRGAPRLGKVLTGQGDRDYRELLQGDHIIVHEVSDRDQTVTIHRVWPIERGRPQFSGGA